MDNAVPHLQSDADMKAALQAMYRTLTPGGLLLLSTRDYDELGKYDCCSDHDALLSSTHNNAPLTACDTEASHRGRCPIAVTRAMHSKVSAGVWCGCRHQFTSFTLRVVQCGTGVLQQRAMITTMSSSLYCNQRGAQTQPTSGVPSVIVPPTAACSVQSCHSSCKTLALRTSSGSRPASQASFSLLLLPSGQLTPQRDHDALLPRTPYCRAYMHTNGVQYSGN